MRTSETPWILHHFGANKSFGFCTYRRPSSKSFRMRTYRNRGEGATAARYRPGTSPAEWIESFPNTVLQWPEREKRRIPWNAGSEVEEKGQFVFENESGNKTDV